ncbi:DUF2274 domain-containing protein [Sphingobium phenoxybenzoativorans]|uniref:DUF2274 domain-containing protein n=1 Tax=Sphingobium phenoxybenzoativorans TaxID=1592790 RepID=UPI000871F0FE|nr:DUF2274 domain-containing protein [Sphingobium phenoxybenzoativorans]
MPDIKLARIPDRTPVKLTLSITPDLNQALHDYAALYAVTYGRQEHMVDLVPAMLRSFLDSDKAFIRYRQAGN